MIFRPFNIKSKLLFNKKSSESPKKSEKLESLYMKSAFYNFLSNC